MNKSNRFATWLPGTLPLAFVGKFICLAFTFTVLVLPQRAEAQFTTKPAVIMGKGSGKCVSVQNGSTAVGAYVIQATCNSADSKWTMVPQAGGPSPQVLLVANNSGLCLSVAWGSTADSTPVVQYACTGVASQLWTVQNFGQFYRLIASHSGKCLNVFGAAETSGAYLIQWPCQGADSEVWSFSEGFLGPSQVSRIVNTSSGLCADVYYFSSAVNTGIDQWTCKTTGVRNQEWFFQRASDGYQLIAQNSNMCLAPLGGATAAGIGVVQVTCGTALSQIWHVNPSGRNYINASGSTYTITNKNSSMCLDLGSPPGLGAFLVQHSCNGAATQTWQVTSAWDGGIWSDPLSLPLVPVAAAALNNNKIMFWASYDAFTFAQNAYGWTQTALFDIATNTVAEVQVSNTGHDMFCPGTAMLADGRVLVNGGDTAAATSIYDPVANSWSIGGNMNIPRAYNADAVLDSGKVFTIGGSWNGGLGGKEGELWNPPAGGWATLPGAPATPMTAPDPQGVFRGDNHAWLFNTGGGVVFQAGPSVQMNWFNTNGSGSSTPAGNRGTDTYSMNGSAVMYGINKILKLGGAPAYQNANAVTSAYTINIKSGVVVTQTGSLTYARSFQNSVVLPDGRVFVAGGQSYANPFYDGQSILAGEMWSPATGSFSTMAAASTPRNYHSVALLLQDGRVLSGGGGLCGDPCENNHPDFEYYSPSYLFAPSGASAVRPVIVSAPGTAGYNSQIRVMTSDASVTSFVLIRMGAATHGVDNDQRRIPLSISGQSGTNYTVKTPANSGIGTPGYYMLFALNGAGVPSVAAIIRIG
jgi:galactose oxidase